MMVFGAISMKGKIFFQIIPQKTKENGKNYCENMLPPLFEAIKLKHNNWILMQDNAKPHTKLETMQFLKENGVKTLPHPPNSPDLNPI